MDDGQERSAQLRDAADRIWRSLRDAGWEDARWEADEECIKVYDPESEHELSLTVDWG